LDFRIFSFVHSLRIDTSEFSKTFSHVWCKFNAISSRHPFLAVPTIFIIVTTATFYGKRRTLEILTRNISSGGRGWSWVRDGKRGRNSLETAVPGRGISFPWRLPVNATLPPYRSQRRRHRRRRVCSCSCAPWFRFRFSHPRSPFSPGDAYYRLGFELLPTPPNVPSPSVLSLWRSLFASVRITLTPSFSSFSSFRAM